MKQCVFATLRFVFADKHKIIIDHKITLPIYNVFDKLINFNRVNKDLH